MAKVDRRKFIGSALGAAGLVGAGTLAGSMYGESGRASAPPVALVKDGTVRRPTDRVLLGKSGISVSLVGIGTGTNGYGGGSRQTRLGQEAFTKIMRHALDAGIVFFDLADSYGSHSYFAEAMKGVPRDRYVIQTKTDTRDPMKVREDIDRYLRELKTDHVDSLIVHCVTESDWTKRYAGVLEAFSDARAAGKVRAHGVTCHSWDALEAAAASDWVQVNQVRWNPGRAHMDGAVDDARTLFAGMRRKGQGMIGMKVVGQGDLVGSGRKMTPDDCFRFQIESGVVDAFVVGVDSTAQVDALVSGTQTALDSVGYRRIDVA